MVSAQAQATAQAGKSAGSRIKRLSERGRRFFMSAPDFEDTLSLTLP